MAYAAPTAFDRDEIRARLAATRPRIGQLDVNGKCNAKCWYCPVRYRGNPEEFAVQMAPADLDRILGNVRASRVIAPEFRFLYSSHYNEVLIYRHFAEMLPLLRRHGFATMILSNGTPLTPEKTDLILDNRDVIWGVTLNVPALDRDDWARKAGLPASMHRLLLRNLDYMHGKYPAHIQVNCLTGAAGSLEHGIANDKNEAQGIAAAFRARYPGFRVTLQEALSDRAGLLEAHAVLSRGKKAEGRVVGCAHSANENGRIFGWLHINARGDLFLCCDDYDMEYRFGNLLTDRLEDIWLSDRHVDVVAAAFAGICRGCAHRIETPG